MPVMITPSGIVKYPVEPLSAWLNRLVTLAEMEYDWYYTPAEGEVALAPRRRVATQCGITIETLTNYLKCKTKWVDERVIDAICSSEGSLHVEDLYPEYRSRPRAKVRRDPRAHRTLVVA